MSQISLSNFDRPELTPVRCVASLDADRYAACLAYLTGRVAAASNNRTQLYLVKALILADLYALQHDGRPIIGGPLTAWPQGPVNDDVYDKLCVLIEAKQANMPLPFGFRVTSRLFSRAYDFSSSGPADEDELSPLERSALSWAWSEVGQLTISGLSTYTHSPSTFMGAAWRKATGGAWAGNRSMDWLDLMRQFDRFKGTNHYDRMKDQILTSAVRIPFDSPHDAPVVW